MLEGQATRTTAACTSSRTVPSNSDVRLAVAELGAGGGGGGGDGVRSGSWSSGVGVVGSPRSGRARRGDGGVVIPAVWTACILGGNKLSVESWAKNKLHFEQSLLLPMQGAPYTIGTHACGCCAWPLWVVTSSSRRRHRRR